MRNKKWRKYDMEDNNNRVQINITHWQTCTHTHAYRKKCQVQQNCFGKTGKELTWLNPVKITCWNGMLRKKRGISLQTQKQTGNTSNTIENNL